MLGLTRFSGATAACVFLGLAATNGAHAALVCTPGNIVGAGNCAELVSISPTATDIDPPGVSLIIDKWQSNAAAGFVETLTSVEFVLNATLSSSGSITNNTNQKRSYVITNTSDFTVSAGAGAPSNFLASPLIFTLDTGLTVSNVLGHSTVSFSKSANAPAQDSGLITTSLGEYTGPGTFAALLSTSTDTGLTGGGGNLVFSLTTLASADISVTYNFDTEPDISRAPPTPIPAALPLFATGAGVLGWAARRARKNRAA